MLLDINETLCNFMDNEMFLSETYNEIKYHCSVICTCVLLTQGLQWMQVPFSYNSFTCHLYILVHWLVIGCLAHPHTITWSGIGWLKVSYTPTQHYVVRHFRVSNGLQVELLVYIVCWMTAWGARAKLLHHHLLREPKWVVCK